MPTHLFEMLSKCAQKVSEFKKNKIVCFMIWYSEITFLNKN